MNTDIALGERIRRWRKSRDGVTKAELARRVGVSPEAVIQWENGKTSPTHDNVAKIAEAIGVSVSRFWGYVPPDPDAEEDAASAPAHTPKRKKAKRAS